MSAGVKITGFDDMSEMFERAATILDNEDRIRELAHEALRPVADLMYANVQKRSGHTADDIRIGDEPSKAGTIRVAVGFSRSKEGRSFVAHFLEYGTAKMRAYPFIRPAYDSTGGAEGASQRVAQLALAMIAPALKL